MESKLETYLNELREYKIHFKSAVEQIEASTGKSMREAGKSK